VREQGVDPLATDGTTPPRDCFRLALFLLMRQSERLIYLKSHR
jgi:hypothetical protein